MQKSFVIKLNNYVIANLRNDSSFMIEIAKVFAGILSLDDSSQMISSSFDSLEFPSLVLLANFENANFFPAFGFCFFEDFATLDDWTLISNFFSRWISYDCRSHSFAICFTDI